MHEAGIAASILDIAIATAKNNSADNISLIHCKVGKMSAVDEQSLKFAFDALKADTIAKNAILEYEEIPLKGKCNNCQTESIIDGIFTRCPKCDSQDVAIISGNELAVSYIET